MNYVLIANIFSFVWAILLGISTFSKKRNKMLSIQTGDCVFNSLACLFVGSYAGFTTNIISGIRNILNIKCKMTKWLLIIITILILVIWIISNQAWIIWFLPPIASVQYTLWSSTTKSAQRTRMWLVINLIIWLIHDIFMKIYPSATMDLIIIIVAIINIFHWKKTDITKKSNIH